MPEIPNTPGVALILFGLIALVIASTTVKVTGTINADLSSWPARTLAVLLGVYLCGFGAFLLRPVKSRYVWLLACVPALFCALYFLMAVVASWPPFTRTAQEYIDDGQKALSKGNCHDAQKAFTRSLQLEPNEDLRGTAELALGKAAECESTQTKEQPSLTIAIKAYRDAAASFNKMKNWNGMKEALQRVVALQPTREAWKELVTADQNMEPPDLTSAEHASEEALKMQPDSSGYDEFADFLQQTRNSASAETARRTAQCLRSKKPPIDPSGAYARLNRGAGHEQPANLLCEYESISQALSENMSEVARCQENDDPCWIGFLHKDFGIFLNSQGFYYRAIDELQAAQTFKERDKDVYVIAGLGDAYKHLGDEEKACSYYDKALDLAKLPPEQDLAQHGKGSAGCT